MRFPFERKIHQTGNQLSAKLNSRQAGIILVGKLYWWENYIDGKLYWWENANGTLYKDLFHQEKGKAQNSLGS